MKILQVEYRGRSMMKYIVDLSGPEDQGRTDQEIIWGADNGSNYNGHCQNFGGSVERLANGKARVTVYTD